MRLHTLKPAEGSLKKSKRIGRGQGSGKGGTSTKGHKGDQSRSGFFVKRGFEGGQMPLQRRSPKFGFKNLFKTQYEIFNICDLQVIADRNKLTEITAESLYKAGAIKSASAKIKILGNGEITSSLTVKANKFSGTAQAAIEAKGGQAIVIE